MNFSCPDCSLRACGVCSPQRLVSSGDPEAKARLSGNPLLESRLWLCCHLDEKLHDGSPNPALQVRCLLICVCRCVSLTVRRGVDLTQKRV